MTPATRAGAPKTAKKELPRARGATTQRTTRPRPAGSAKEASATMDGARPAGKVKNAAAATVAGRSSKKAPTKTSVSTAGGKSVRRAPEAARPRTRPAVVTSRSTPRERANGSVPSGKKVPEKKVPEKKVAEKKVAEKKVPEKKVARKQPAGKAEIAPRAPKGRRAPEEPAHRAQGAAPAVAGVVAVPKPPSAPPATTAAAKKRAPARRAPAPTGPYAQDEKFLREQRELLESTRAVYQGQALDLKAEADSLAQEREPGDVQFDEESGEGGTVTVDRERDLALSAQALATVEEIDAALKRIVDRSYGACERCLQPIPKPRLRALPFARLCVACKSGGLSRR